MCLNRLIYQGGIGMIERRMRNKIMRSLCDTYYKDYREKINLKLISMELKIPYQEVIKIAINLESQDYLKYLSPKEIKETKRLDDGTLASVYKEQTEQVFVSLTDKGKSYFEVNSDKKLEFIRKSILTPILVSFLTTLSIHLLSEYLPRLIEWVQLHLNF